MSLQELKEVENLKMELSEIQKKVFDKRDIIRKKQIEQVQSDFKRFFADNDFKIEESAANFHGSVVSIVASYGELSATLSTQPNDKEYMGHSFRFDLTIALPKKKEYYAMLYYEPFGSNIRPITNPNVEHVKNQIENEKLRLEHIDEEYWYLTLKMENQSQPRIQLPTEKDDAKHINEKFDSMYDLLRVITE